MVKQIKQQIVDELFKNVNNETCILDTLLKEGNVKRQKMILDAALDFLKVCEAQLKREKDNISILFLRKCAYEKILNTYLNQRYQSSDIELNLFPTENEIKRQLEEKQKCKRMNEEAEILKNIIRLDWNDSRSSSYKICSHL